MAKFRRKIKWKNLLSFVLVGVLLVGAVAGLGSIFGKETKTISSTAFSVGGINDEGNYVETETSIYTKEMFECQGLTIEPDFEATGTYKIFYYDANKNFMSATESFNAEDGVYTKGRTEPFAMYARIMITPDVPTDENGKEVKDFKIRFYEVMGYANDYEIMVNKLQVLDYSGIDLVDYLEIYTGKCHNFHLDYIEGGKINEVYACSSVVYPGDYEQLKVVVPAGGRMGFVFYDSEGNNLDVGVEHFVSAVESADSVEEVVEILPGTSFIGFNFDISKSAAPAEYQIYFE